MERKEVPPDNHTHKRKQASEALKRWHRVSRPHAKRCGAQRKYDGCSCEREALENGRCHLHGGLTPKGDDWHKPRWPKRDTANSEKRFARKLKNLQKAREVRAARIAAMTPDELERYRRWCESHKPGSAKKRAEANLRRKMSAQSRKLISDLLGETTSDGDNE